MSGPIVRKYGFPNFEQIFGKRDLEHGIEGKQPVDPLHREAQSPVEPLGTAEKPKPAGEAPAKN